jgi:murein L,D-transpeptidase YcbB/YkuD
MGSMDRLAVAIGLASMAGPALAQVVPPPVVPTTPAPAPIVQPLPGQITEPLPVLSDAQKAQLGQLLRQASSAQGLRRIDSEMPLPTDNDGLVRAALDYARAVNNGRLAEEDFAGDWGMRPPAYDPFPAFKKAVAENRLSAWIATLPPPWTGYEALREGLEKYRQIEALGGWATLAAGPDLGLGATGPRVVALRKRLAAEDMLVKLDGARFDAELQEAVKRAQKRYGLNQSGLVSTQTLAALNVPVRERIHQIMANMERWRWLPAQLPPKRIQVNVATAQLTVFDGDSPIASMKVVTGAPSTATPMLSSTIHSIVINPPWNVPSSIANGELWPKEKASPGYLRRNGFRVIETEGGGKRLQQAAGPQSALGRFKFDFDNQYAVYLHDTPSQSTFTRFDRLASHGCVRLSRPRELADLLLATSPEWTQDKIEETLASGKTVRAALPEPVAVYLLYWTAFASSDGSVSFRGDPYGWDRQLAEKIETRADKAQFAAR